MLRQSLRAFTLVELSIVLVILGLLVGGVLAGQSLIHAAELRAVGREYQQYQTALGAFKDKYLALPGDMPNAVRYWGAQDGSTNDGMDAVCAGLSTPAPGTATCNGDGNGLIAQSGRLYESFRAWQHLQNAGLVEGRLEGVMGDAAEVGRNVPRSKISNAGWQFFGLGTGQFDPAGYFYAEYGSSFFFGGNNANMWTQHPVISAEDAYNIDMKLDDGKPHTGRMMAYKNAWAPACTTTTNQDYALGNTNKGCSPIFITGY